MWPIRVSRSTFTWPLANQYQGGLASATGKSRLQGTNELSLADTTSQAQSLASYDTAIVLPPASDDAPMGRATERGEEFGDADSQNSYKDSMSSLIDFDPDETMASQQTAATEVTMPLPSRVRQVSLRVHSRVEAMAYLDSTRKHFDFVCVSLILRCKPTRRISPYRDCVCSRTTTKIKQPSPDPLLWSTRHFPNYSQPQYCFRQPFQRGLSRDHASLLLLQHPQETVQVKQGAEKYSEHQRYRVMLRKSRHSR